MNTSTLSKELLSMILLLLRHAFCSGDMTIQLVLSAFDSSSRIYIIYFEKIMQLDRFFILP